MSYTVHQAKTNLSRLIKEAENGTEVVITRGKKPVAKLVPIASTLQEAYSWQHERPDLGGSRGVRSAHG